MDQGPGSLASPHSTRRALRGRQREPVRKNRLSLDFPPSARHLGKKRIAAPAPKPQLPLASPGKRRWMMHGDLRPVPGLGPVGFTSAAAAPLRRGRSPTSTARPRRGAAQLDSASDCCRRAAVSSVPGRARWVALLPPPLRCAAGGRQPARPAPGGARRSSTPLPTAAPESLSLRPRAGPGGPHFCRRRSTALRAVTN